MTTTPTLADWAHTCRQRAATLLENAGQAEDLAREYGHRGNGPANRYRDEAADWQALAGVVYALSLRPEANLYPLYAEAVERLVARLDRP